MTPCAAGDDRSTRLPRRTHPGRRACSSAQPCGGCVGNSAALGVRISAEDGVAEADEVFGRFSSMLSSA